MAPTIDIRGLPRLDDQDTDILKTMVANHLANIEVLGIGSQQWSVTCLQETHPPAAWTPIVATVLGIDVKPERTKEVLDSVCEIIDEAIEQALVASKCRKAGISIIKTFTLGFDSSREGSHTLKPTRLR